MLRAAPGVQLCRHLPKLDFFRKVELLSRIVSLQKFDFAEKVELLPSNFLRYCYGMAECETPYVTCAKDSLQ